MAGRARVNVESAIGHPRLTPGPVSRRCARGRSVSPAPRAKSEIIFPRTRGNPSPHLLPVSRATLYPAFISGRLKYTKCPSGQEEAKEEEEEEEEEEARAMRREKIKGRAFSSDRAGKIGGGTGADRERPSAAEVEEVIPK